MRAYYKFKTPTNTLKIPELVHNWCDKRECVARYFTSQGRFIYILDFETFGVVLLQQYRWRNSAGLVSLQHFYENLEFSLLIFMHIIHIWKHFKREIKFIQNSWYIYEFDNITLEKIFFQRKRNKWVPVIKVKQNCNLHTGRINVSLFK